MTKSGSFKRAMRQRARASGKSYTQVLAEVTGDESARPAYSARRWRNEGLAGLVAFAYGTSAEHAERLSKGPPSRRAELYRVDWPDEESWVARVFPRGHQHLPDLDGDVRILQLLEAHDFPAEHLVEMLSIFDGPTVLLTTFVEGQPAGGGPSALGEFIGRLHALPVTQGDVGRRTDPLEVAGGLPEALTLPVVDPRAVIFQSNGVCAGVDWKAAGWGPRLPALASLLGSVETVRPDVVDAMLDGYRRHITLTTEEIDRFPTVIGAHASNPEAATVMAAAVARLRA